MLNKNEFEVLDSLNAHPRLSQREIAQEKELSVGSVNAALKSLVSQGLVVQGMLTDEGKEEISKYRVDNAIILAAGLSSRLAPISYEQPKGLLKVRGEVLIERQIKQLQNAGIDDITVVVGYKKELFFYLEDKFGVSIVVNEEYAFRNNNSSIMAAKDKLSNTYICCSDYYFPSNPYKPYVWKAYYAAQYSDGMTDEWCMEVGAGQRIIRVVIGGSNAWYMVGQAYFDRKFSQHLIDILVKEYNLPATASKYWEDLYIDHIDEFDMRMKKYPEGFVFEFDYFDQVREFDPYFLDNIDSRIFSNIERILDCDKNDIHDVYPLSQGITNLSCHFEVDGAEYVYRHPGVGTEKLIDRKAECAAQHVAEELGLDDTFIHEDPDEGWKISRFIPNARSLDPKDPQEVKNAMKMAAQLHKASVSVDKVFDFYEEGKRYEKLFGDTTTLDNVPGYREIAEKVNRLKEYTNQDETRICFCHSDFCHLNFLVDETGRLYLIDWEYSGMADYASDFATFVICGELSEQEALEALSYYFGRNPSESEIRHNFAFVVFASWYWYLWYFYKETCGENTGVESYTYYKYVKVYLDKVLKMYEKALPGKRRIK